MLEHANYCATLLTRVAEVKALAQLSAPSKDTIFPVLVARPWPNAKSLVRTWEKITEAFPNRRFALDLDETKRNADSDKGAAVEFEHLFSAGGGYPNYYAAVADMNAAIPVFQLDDPSPEVIRAQLDRASNIDRGLILRIRYLSGAFRGTLADIAASGINASVVVDVGWGRDILLRELWASEVIEQVSLALPEAEFVLSGSSFPESFAGMGARAEFDARERRLFANVVRRFNMIDIKYGDWGSTRPPTSPTPMRNIPRIDLPLSREWICFRQDGSETYTDIARRAISDDVWPSDLHIWGTYLIEATAEGLPGSIASPASAASARINIHLHRQATFGLATAGGDADEPYVDD